MESSPIDRAVDLVVAIARGDAFPEDVPSHVKREGHEDDLDAMIASLGEAARQARDPALPHQPIDPSIFARPNPPEMFKDKVYRMELPFLHDGVVYDPQDIARFNGQELHLVTLRGQVLAFAGRKSIARIWELLYVTRNVDPTRNTSLAIPELTVSDMGPVPPEYIFPDIDEDDIGSHFYEHAWHGGYGDHLFCPKNRGYERLSEVCRGFLCTDDWNDIISSFRCWSTAFESCNIAQLCDHAGYWGLTLTSIGDGRECYAYHELDTIGFNDITSSVGAW